MELCRQHRREPIYISPWAVMIREVSSMGHVFPRDNVNRGYPLTAWMPPPPLSWKAPGVVAEKKNPPNKVMTQVDGSSERGKLSLFNYWSISACSSACIRPTSETWGVLFVRLLWHSPEGFMDVHAPYQNLFSGSGDERQASEGFFLFGGVTMSVVSFETSCWRHIIIFCGESVAAGIQS